MYVKWDKPRRWSVRLYNPGKGVSGKFTGYGHHVTMGIIAMSVAGALEAAQKMHPNARIESVNDTGQVDVVVDCPEFTTTVDV